MRETSQVEINLEAVSRNLGVVRSVVGPNCGLCPIVKADAYGLGAVRIARRLAASGADMLAVYSPEQAASLARLGLASPILVLMPVHEIRRSDELHRALAAGRLHLVLHDEAHLSHLDRLARRLAVSMPVHLEVDTGLTRGGAPPEAALRMVRRLSGTPLHLAGIFTHFSDPVHDPHRTREQLDLFDRVVAAAGSDVPRSCVQHVASTAALLRHRAFHRGMVRFGIAWAGYDPLESEPMESDGRQAAAPELAEGAGRLSPCLTWSSRLVQVRRVPAGVSVGYGSQWTASRPSILGLIPVGYADGFPRIAPSARQAPMVAILPEWRMDREGPQRFHAPVVGRVNMDQITVDLTDVLAGSPGSGPGGTSRHRRGEIGVGTRVELVSPDPSAPNHLSRLAADAGTIPHELLCRIAGLCRRVYIEDAATSLVLEARQVASAG